MTDLSAQPITDISEDRTIAGIVYVLFLLLPVFFPVLIGLVLAYSHRDRASPMLRSHYIFQIRTFWLLFGWVAVACGLLAVGIPFSILLVGLPAVALGGFILCSLGLWFGLRAVAGLVYLARGESYPRPQTWLI
jgi:uncharacterized membrane protein